MTKEQFVFFRRARTQEANRRVKKMLMVAVLGLVGSFLIAVLVKSHFGSKAAGGVFELMVLAVVACMYIYSRHLAAWSRREALAYGLKCPSCARVIDGAPALTAIDTGLCIHCGKKVFDD